MSKIELNWERSEFGGLETICAKITPRVTATVCPHQVSFHPLKPILASIDVGSVTVAFEYCETVDPSQVVRNIDVETDVSE